MTYPPPWNSGQGYPPPGYGYPPPYPEPPRSNARWIIVSIAAVLVVVVSVAVIVWDLTGGDEEQSAASTTTSSSMKASTRASTTSSTTRTTRTTPSAPAPRPTECEGRVGTPGPATPAGWKQVVSPRGLVYDVPPEWDVLTCTTLIGWEKKCPESPDSPFGVCPIRTMSGAAQLPNPTCPDVNSLAVSGVPGAKSAPDNATAVQNETALVTDIYTSESGVVPNVALSAPRDLTVAGAPAVEVVATVTGISPDNCYQPNALHVMIATTVAGQPGSVMFIISMGYVDAPDTGTIDKMVGSLRLVG